MNLTVLQYNILADGLADDDFICTDTLTTVDGNSHTIKELMEQLSQIDKNDLDELKKFRQSYETEKNQQSYQEVINWINRWQKILDLIQSHDIDIIVFQELDHFTLALEDLGKLGFIAYVSGDEPYQALHETVSDVRDYLTSLEQQNYTFLPKLNSKAFKYNTIRKENKGLNFIDNDGCAIFWKADRFKFINMEIVQYDDAINDDKKKSDNSNIVMDGDGALAVTLFDQIGQEELIVITTHLPSGQSTIRELERSRIVLKYLQPFVEHFISQNKIVILAMDANSDPLAKYSEQDNIWTILHKNGLKNIWDGYFYPNGTLIDEKQYPVSVNKIRGPKSNQLSKIGVHAYELIDHIYYYGDRIKFQQFLSAPIIFKNQTNALAHLIPNTEQASDHYPILVQFLMGPK